MTLRNRSLPIGDFVGTLLYGNVKELSINALAPAHSVDSLYASFNSGRTEMHARIDAVIQEMRDGTVDRIHQAHVGADLSEVLGQ